MSGLQRRRDFGGAVGVAPSAQPLLPSPPLPVPVSCCMSLVGDRRPPDQQVSRRTTKRQSRRRTPPHPFEISPLLSGRFPPAWGGRGGLAQGLGGWLCYVSL